MTTAPMTMHGKDPVDVELFDRLVGRVASDSQVNDGLASRIIDQTLAFLTACASNPQSLSPSQIVDLGWHTFIPHTHEWTRAASAR